jgi:cullin-4
LQRKAQSLVAEESEEKDKQVIAELLAFKAEMDELISDAFAKNEAFSSALKTALEFAVNTRENKPAELLGEGLPATYLKV